MSSHPCFWMEPTGDVEIHLRRFVFSAAPESRCTASGMGYHNAETNTHEQGPAGSYPDVHGDRWSHDDPRWPKVCACGYVFQPQDQWQFRPEALYARTDTGQRYTLDDAPAGAMFHCDWRHDGQFYKRGADGIMLMVKLPDRTWWCVDGPATPNGQMVNGAWSRSGAVPNVTVTPSILIGGSGHPVSYHGFLTNGVLNSCSDSPC